MAADFTRTSWPTNLQPLGRLLPSLAALALVAVATLLVTVPNAQDRILDTPSKRLPVKEQAAATPAYIIKSRLPSAALNHGDWRWDESQAPATGPIFIAIDTASQTLTVFRDGHAIGVAVIVFGDDRKPTPLGNFRVKAKAADYWSRTYDAPMPHSLRLTDDGVAIHGSEEIAADLASHGCIGLPRPFARKLFGVVAVGDPVRITKGVFVKEGDAIPLV